MANITSIRRWGDDLHIHTDNGKTIICRGVSSTTWLGNGSLIELDPGADPGPVDPNPNPNPGDPSSIAQSAANWMTSRLGKFAYSQVNPGRLDPDNSGYGDCSSVIYRAYLTYGVMVGTWTGDMVHYGTQIVPPTPASGWAGVQHLVKVGDCILYSWYSNSIGTYDHVDMLLGGDSCVGHGGPDAGPKMQQVSRQLSWSPSTFEIRRYA